MHSRMHVLFICVVQSLYLGYMRIYHTCFSTPTCVCRKGLEVGSFSACPWLALVADVEEDVLAE